MSKHVNSSRDDALCPDAEQQHPLLATTEHHSPSRASRLIRAHYRLIAISYIFTAVVCGLVASAASGAHAPSTMNVPLVRRWGGFEERPNTNKCYRQERTAMILALLLGGLGVDQWFAHHWVLAACKMLLPLVGLVLCVIMLPFGGNFALLPGASLWSLATLWCFVDVLLWMVGGVYGTPGCPGGDGWRY